MIGVRVGVEGMTYFFFSEDIGVDGEPAPLIRVVLKSEHNLSKFIRDGVVEVRSIDDFVVVFNLGALRLTENVRFGFSLNNGIEGDFSRKQFFSQNVHKLNCLIFLKNSPKFNELLLVLKGDNLGCPFVRRLLTV